MDSVFNNKEHSLADIPLALSDSVQRILARRSITTIEKVLLTSNMDLIAYGLTSDQVDSLKSTVSSFYPSEGYMTALECSMIMPSKWRHITFGCASLDKITRNGLPIRGITEIVGESGCGKSQICLQLALNVQLPIASGGLDKSTVYICTENAFPSKRLVQMAFRRKIGPDSLDKIFVEHCADTENLLNCIFNRLPLLMAHKSVGLIIIDSVAGVFRLESDAISRANNMRKMILSLQTMADQHECAVICVNQVTAAMTEHMREKCVPCLGLAWSNLVTTQLKIRKLNKQIADSSISNVPITVRSLEIGFSPDLPNETAEFIITEKGICDVQNNYR